MKPAGWVALGLLLAVPVATRAQGLAGRVGEVREGVVRMTYAARPGVLFCDHGIRMRSRAGESEWNQDGFDTDVCRQGPARVELEVREGRVRGVKVLRTHTEPTRGAVDLGEVPAPAAARYLLSVARTAPDKAARAAIFAAVLANADDAPFRAGLLEVARDRDLSSKVRSSALFWLGQEAAATVTAGLADVASDEDEEQSVRDAAIFALSQRPQSEGVPILMKLARTARQAETRRKAMFWLAQSHDPRVLDFFESVLLPGGR